MALKKIPGTRKNPLILKPLIQEQSAFSKHHGGLSPDKVSDMHDKPSIKKYVRNLLSNRHLSSYSKEIGIWLRLNLDGYENIISMHEVRAKQRFPVIGELVKAKDVEDIKCQIDIPSKYIEAVKLCKELISESEISVYQYCMNNFDKEDLKFLVGLFYNGKIPQFNSGEFEKEKYAEWLVKYFERETSYQDAKSFSEIAQIYWSRSELFDFATDVLKMDDEELHYLMCSSLEEMVDFISHYYFESDIYGDENDKDFWLIYFSRNGVKNKEYFYLSFPCSNGIAPKFIQARKIHDDIYNGGFDPFKFYQSLLELESFGYIRLSPLNQSENDGLLCNLLHPSPKVSDDKNKADITDEVLNECVCYYYHLQFNSLISMRDYSLYWNGINRDIEDIKRKSEVKKNELTKLSKRKL